MQWAQSDDARMKECSMGLIENVPGLFGIDQNNGLDQIKQVCWSKMSPPKTLMTILLQAMRTCMNHADAEVRSSAVKAFTAFVIDNDESDQVLKSFTAVVPDMLKVS